MSRVPQAQILDDGISSMKVPQITMAIASMIFTLGSMATMWVFSAASLANNTSAEALRQVKTLALIFSLLSVSGIALGIWLLCRRRPGWASVVAVFPSLVMGGLLVYFLLRP